MEGRIIAAFGIVYVIWGSTYLAIRIMVAGLPPYLSAGVRFFVAGILMLVYARWRGMSFPSVRAEWGAIIVTSLMMLVGANGLVTWSEQWVDSGQVALIVATSALWIAYFASLGAEGEKSSRRAVVGLMVGLVGVAALVGESLRFVSTWNWAYPAVLLAPMLWALGSVIAKRSRSSVSPFMAASMQSLIAGAVLTGIGLTAGEGDRWNWEPTSLAALAYLTIFGTCIAYASYFWLVHHVSPASLGTYAYVNPVIAVLLGAAVLDERLNPIQIAGTIIIVLSVVFVNLTTWVRRRAQA